jgi:1-acyl-sn-glycerol-3-phosphate acyltransferase
MTAISLAETKPIEMVRVALRSLWIGAALLVCLPLHLVWRLFELSSPWPRFFLRVAARACGARVKLVGKPLRHEVFYVANHLSWLDILVIGGLTGTTFVSQDGVASWPIVGWLAKLNRTIFISRTDKFAVAEQIANLRDAIAEHQAVTIFPEGTTTDGRTLLPFKPSLFATVVPPPKKLLIQPVLLDFDAAGKDLAWVGEENALENAWRVFTQKGSFEIRVHFLEAFDPGDHPDRKLLTAEARRRIAAALSKTLGYQIPA